MHIFPRWRFDTPGNQQIMFSYAQCNCARKLWFNIQCSMLNSPISVFLWQQLPLVHLKVSHFYDLRQLAEGSISLVFSPSWSIEIVFLFSRLFCVSDKMTKPLTFSVWVGVLWWRSMLVVTYVILQLDKESFSSCFCFFLFLCIWQGGRPPSAAAGQWRGSCFVFFLCFCFCFSVTRWNTGTPPSRAAGQWRREGGRNWVTC